MTSKRVLVYEFIAGGGTFSWASSSPPARSLLREGAAMLGALAMDLASLEGVEVVALRDVRLANLKLPGCTVVDVRSAEDEHATLRRWARRADWTVLIAPEFDGLLVDRCRIVEAAGGRSLSPGSDWCALASDKQRTAEHLAARGIRTPEGIPLPPGGPLPVDFPYPAVLKPRDGAGSQGIRLIRRPEEAGPSDWASGMRLERWCRGLPASVALLCGPSSALPLAPCAQRLSQDGRLRYLGGSTPLPDKLARRAKRVAGRVAASLPPTVGYVGIDLILDDEAEASDCVIEVNPRLTTSYLGLRRLARMNLAQAMLDQALGRDVELSFGSRRVEFSAPAIT